MIELRTFITGLGLVYYLNGSIIWMSGIQIPTMPILISDVVVLLVFLSFCFGLWIKVSFFLTSLSVCFVAVVMCLIFSISFAAVVINLSISVCVFCSCWDVSYLFLSVCRSLLYICFFWYCCDVYFIFLSISILIRYVLWKNLRVTSLTTIKTLRDLIHILDRFTWTDVYFAFNKWSRLVRDDQSTIVSLEIRLSVTTPAHLSTRCQSKWNASEIKNTLNPQCTTFLCSPKGVWNKLCIKKAK